MKLRPKILFLVLGILIASLTSLSLPLYWYIRSALEAEMDQGLLGILEISQQMLDERLISLLIREPSLEGIRHEVDSALQTLLVQKVQGAAVFTTEGEQLASVFITPPAEPLIGSFLSAIITSDLNSAGIVSDIYQLTDGNYFKAAATFVEIDNGNSVILVIWSGAQFMTFIDQLRGSILWTLIIAIIIAMSLTFIFTRSLLSPVKQLSDYAKAIQRNIKTDPVDLARKDELGDLNRALNEMHREINENEKKNRQFLADVAHEIKNPLGGLELYLGLIGEETDNHNLTREYLEKVSHEIDNLKHVVSSYLDYSRPMNNSPKQLHLRSVIMDVYQVVKPEIVKLGTRFEIMGDCDFFGDELKLKRVFLNLFKNSLDAMDKDNGRISVEIESSGLQIIIKFSDNGAGIPLVLYEKLFDPYFTTRENGVGLGLSIVKNIIEEMSGTVFIESSIESGTEFIITLPK